MTLDGSGKPLTQDDAEALAGRGLPVPAAWTATPGPLPCRTPLVRSPDGTVPTVLARRDILGLYHPWVPLPAKSRAADLRRCQWCRPRRQPWLDDTVIHPAYAPYRQRCPGYIEEWPNYTERLIAGPLPDQLVNKAGRIPRWYAWWRLYEMQDERCATCDRPPQAIDHCHQSLRLRGLLCRDCNAREALYQRGFRLCVHPAPYCFEAYWATPPAAALGWYWPANTLRPTSFLTSPPTGPRRTFPRYRAGGVIEWPRSDRNSPPHPDPAPPPGGPRDEGRSGA